MTRSKMNNDENAEKCEHEEWIIRNVHSPWICANHQHGWENSDRQIYDSMDIAAWYPITTDCLQPEEGNWVPADFPPADIPPEVVQNPTSDMPLSNMDNDENPEKCEHEEWINRKLHSPWICINHQHGGENSDMQIYDIRDIAEWYPITTDCLQPDKGNCLSHAVCDDSVALMPLIHNNWALFSDGGDTAGRSGHDRDDGGSPTGLLGYLPRCYTG